MKTIPGGCDSRARIKIATVGVVLLSLAGTAAAQAPAVSPSPAPKELSESRALGLSASTTLASWFVLIGGALGGSAGVAAAGGLGTMFGPSTGHIYRGKLLTSGFVVRGIGLVAMGTGVGLELRCFEHCESNLGGVLAVLGLFVYIGGTVHDIAEAPSEVRKHNQRLKSVTVAPMITGQSVGFALGGQF